MVFNATFNNISVISWWSVLLVGKPEYPEKTNDLSQVTNKHFTHGFSPRHEQIQTHNISGDRH